MQPCVSAAESSVLKGSIMTLLAKLRFIREYDIWPKHYHKR